MARTRCASRFGMITGSPGELKINGRGDGLTGLADAGIVRAHDAVNNFIRIRIQIRCPGAVFYWRTTMDYSAYTVGAEQPTHTLRASNEATESENKIHDDTVAAQYGFRGGLVPGVSV